MPPKKPQNKATPTAHMGLDVLPIVVDAFRNAGARQIKEIPTKDPDTLLIDFVAGRKQRRTSIDLAAWRAAQQPKKFITMTAHAAVHTKS